MSNYENYVNDAKNIASEFKSLAISKLDNNDYYKSYFEVKDTMVEELAGYVMYAREGNFPIDVINEIEAIIEDAGVTVEVDEYIEKYEEEV